MAKVTITIEDLDEGIRILAESDPTFPKNSEEDTAAQRLAQDFIDAVLANASEIEEQTLN